MAFFILVCGACQPDPDRPADLDPAIDDCEMHARAGAGEYAAAFQVCLVDRHGVSADLARALARANGYYRELVVEGNARIRRSTWRLYELQMQMAGNQGADAQWVRARVARDSLILARVDSVMRARSRGISR